MRRTMKARYQQGRIELQEPLELEEGTEVTLSAPVSADPQSMLNPPCDTEAVPETVSEKAVWALEFEQTEPSLLVNGERTDEEVAEQEGAEEVEVDYTYISRAAEDAAHLPDVILQPEDLQALKAVSTDFSFRIDVDEDEEPG
jgi:hypothetical protein